MRLLGEDNGQREQSWRQVRTRLYASTQNPGDYTFTGLLLALGGFGSGVWLAIGGDLGGSSLSCGFV